ncbi:MAG: SGNH/GDSL hydrolase family protein [Armatimonadetes bacterium]|nr:SGNH/GDSL hydrolase family protein [Armatimonadota bacterium]
MAEHVRCARLKPGDRLVCLGDSITADPHGYVAMAQQVLSLSRPGITVINAGVPGETAANMAARFDSDVLAHRPSWVTISAGGNDAVRQIPLAEYERALQDMIGAARSAGARVGLCTPTPFEPQFTDAPVDRVNALIAQYAAWVAQAATEHDLLLIPMHETFRLVQEASDPADPARLTQDGVHMSPMGRYVMGLTFLAAFGVSLEPNAN